jgi:uncharacterized protein
MTRTALITGASAGLGAEFARQLAAQGYNLVLVARRLPRLEALKAAIESDYPLQLVTVMEADLTEAHAPAVIEARLNQMHLAIDYLVNNAGAGGPNLLDGDAWEAHQRYLQLMMLSVAELCHRLVPGMCDRGFGRVVNVSSVAGRMARGGDTHYGPSKAYVVALSEALGLTVRDRGVHVCALCPGFTHTEFHAEGELAEMKASTPSFLWYGADVVVQDALRAVERGKLICISGRLYRWLDPLLQSKLTRRLLQRLA